MKLHISKFGYCSFVKSWFRSFKGSWLSTSVNKLENGGIAMLRYLYRVIELIDSISGNHNVLAYFPRRKAKKTSLCGGKVFSLFGRWFRKGRLRIREQTLKVESHIIYWFSMSHSLLQITDFWACLFRGKCSQYLSIGLYVPMSKCSLKNLTPSYFYIIYHECQIISYWCLMPVSQRDYWEQCEK